MTTLNARQMGHEATVDELRHLLVEQFQVALDPEAIAADDPLFAAGVGLSSLEGIELLAAIEQRYGVSICDIDFWIDESPTLDGMARYLIQHSPGQNSQ
jgi:acyl carrier protein